MSEKLPSLEELGYRDAISKLHDDTVVEEGVAAIFLKVTLKVLKGLRAEDGGPLFIKVAAKRSKGRNQAVTYEMGELRRFRASQKYSSTLEVARRQGLLGWVSGIEPFWATPEKSIIDSAVNQDAPEWEAMFCKAARSEIQILWISPREAIGATWAGAGKHRAFADEYLELLRNEAAGVSASVEASELSESMERRNQ